MPITFEFDVTKDLFFQKGEKQGIEKEKILIVENMLFKSKWSVKKNC